MTDTLAPVVRPAAWRAKAAVTLAQHAKALLDDETHCPGYVTLSVVRACCPQIADGAERMRLWDAYLEAVRQEQQIRDGVIDWRLIDDELTCADRTDVAIEIACQRSADALAALLGGSS